MPIRFSQESSRVQDPITPFMQDIERSMARFDVKPKPIEDESLFRTAGKGLVGGTVELAETVGTAMEWLGHRVDSDFIKGVGKTTRKYWEAIGEPFGPPQEFADKNVWDNPELLANAKWWVSNVSRMAPSLAATLIPGGIAYKLAKGAKWVTASRLLKWKPETFHKLAAAVAGGTAGGALEGAHTYRQILKEGGSELEAARGGEFMALGAGILNAISVPKFMGIAGETFMRKVTKVLGAGAWEGVTEGLEEPTEVFARQISKIINDEPIDPNILELVIQSLKDGLTVLPIAAVAGGGAATVFGTGDDKLADAVEAPPGDARAYAIGEYIRDARVGLPYSDKPSPTTLHPSRQLPAPQKLLQEGKTPIRVGEPTKPTEPIELPSDKPALDKLRAKLKGKPARHFINDKQYEKALEDRAFKAWAIKAANRKVSEEELTSARKFVEREEEDKSFKDWEIKSKRPTEDIRTAELPKTEKPVEIKKKPTPKPTKVEVEKKAEPKPTVPIKEPWEMSRDEVIKREGEISKDIKKVTPKGIRFTDGKFIPFKDRKGNEKIDFLYKHEKAVKKAIDEGKIDSHPDYPNLTPAPSGESLGTATKVETKTTEEGDKIARKFPNVTLDEGAQPGTAGYSWTNTETGESFTTDKLDEGEVRAKVEPKDVWSIFNKTTDMPTYDNILENPEYFKENKGLTSKIEMMSPDEYLKRQAEVKGVELERDLRVVDRDTVEAIKKSIRTGKRKINMLSLEPHLKNQEGRHRAIAAKEMGLKEVPVQIIEEVKAKVEPKAPAKETPKVEKKPAPKEEAPAKKPGMVRLNQKNKTVPFTEFREIKKGKDKGKIEVKYQGRKYKVAKESVKSWPEGAEPAPAKEVKEGEKKGKGETKLQVSEETPYQFSKKQYKDTKRLLTQFYQWLKEAGASKEVLANVKVQLAPIIDLKGKNAADSIKAWEKEGTNIRTILGATTFDNLGALIEVATNRAGTDSYRRTAFHEYLHIAAAWVLPTTEYEALSKHFGTEEKMADAFADFMEKKYTAIKKYPSAIRKLMIKLSRMFNSLRNWMNRKGFTTPEDIFKQLALGAYRPHFAGGAGTAISLEAMTKLKSDKNFKKWFKGSKVTKDGEPLIVAHAGSFREAEGYPFSVEEDGGVHFGTEDAAQARIGGKEADDAIESIEVYKNEDGTWGYEIQGGDYGGEYTTEGEAYTEAEEMAASTESDYYEEDMITYAYLSIKNPKRVADQGKDWSKAILKAKKEGYDGIEYVNQFEDKGSLSYIAFKPNQIKSTQNIGTWDPRTADIRYQAKVPVPWAYSQLLRVVEGAKDMPKKVASLKNWLNKKQVKPEELKWMDVDRWMKENQKDGKINRDEFLDFLKANQIEMREVVRGGVDTGLLVERMQELENSESPLSEEEEKELKGLYLQHDKGWDIPDATKYADYQLPGGEGYREMVFVLPEGVNEKGLRKREMVRRQALELEKEQLGPSDEQVREARADRDLKKEEYTAAMDAFNAANREVGGASQKIRDNVVKAKNARLVAQRNLERINGLYASKQQRIRVIDDEIRTIDAGTRIITPIGSTGPGIPSLETSYRSSHYDEPNVIAHVRFNERVDAEGNKVLFIEEVQSDWLQEAKEKGFKGEKTNRQIALDKLLERAEIFRNRVIKKYKLTDVPQFEGNRNYYNELAKTTLDEADKAEWEGIGRANDDLPKTEPSEGVPKAPFLKNWHEVMMKRMLRYASEHGFDKVAWTTGHQQIDRYETALRMNVDEIRWKRVDGDVPSVEINPWKDGSSQFIETVPLKGTTTIRGKEVALKDVVGKPLAQQIVDSQQNSGTFKGEDLSIGGMGMRSFYDELIPGFLKKYGKQWKASVGKTDIVFDEDPETYEGPTPSPEMINEGKINVWSLPITPEMSEAVLYKGQTWFQAGGKKPTIESAIDSTIAIEKSPGNTAKDALVRHFNDAMYWVVDKNRPIATVQRFLKNVTDDVNVFLKETLRPKITAAKVQMIWEDEIKPLIEKMSKYKVKVETLETYKHALHAHEANDALRMANSKLQVERIVKVLGKDKKKNKAILNDIVETTADLEEPLDWFNALNDIIEKHGKEESLQGVLGSWKTFSEKPSGMSDKEATEILKQHKGDKKIEELGLMLDSINDNSLQLIYDSGLMAEEEFNAIKNKYEHYVPLYREGFDDRLFGTSRGLRPSGRPIKTRGGSTRNVVNILAHSISNYEKAINLSEKARSQRALHGLIEANPESDIISIDEVKKSPRHDAHGNIRMYPDLFNVSDNEMRLMVGGKQYLVSVQRDNKDAMLMMRTLKAEDGMSGPILNTLAKVNRFLARVNTSWSPEFIISNFIRDIQTAGINVQDTGVKGKSMLRGAKDAWGAIYAVERGKPKKTELEGYYRRFKAAGGKIGWSDVHGSVESLGKKITNELKMMEGKAPVRKRVTEWLQLVSDINTSTENGIRLHVFKLAVEQGKTDERAAEIASDLTVDFTKKGAAGPVINSLYLFANAGIQGSYRIFRAGIKSSKVRKTMAGIIGMGFAVGILNALAGGEDDDGEDYFNKIDDFIRERNMIFMLPGTKGKYIKIPLPWGYNVFWNVGSEASRAFTKEKFDTLASAGRLASTFADAFNPVAAGTLLQTLSPTVADPFVQVAENKNWFGGDLMPERNKFDKTPDPDSQRFWGSVSRPSKWVTAQLNALTGGDKVKQGVVDISPETLDLVVDTVGGSALRFVKDTLGIPLKAVLGEEIELARAPFARRVYGAKTKWVDSRIFYENLENVLIAKEQLKVYRGTPNYMKMARALKFERSMIPLANMSERILRRLRKMLKTAKARGNKVAVERINARINAVYIRFNKRYNKKGGGR